MTGSSKKNPDYASLSVCLILAAITFAVYCQIKNHGFINFDDNMYVTNNRYVQDGLTFEGVIRAFSDTHTGIWHPLTWLSHMLDCHLYGLNPKGHHLSSLLLHIANTLLLFLALKRMTDALWRSAFVAALFALHPLHVESVAWVSERKDVLSTFFWMLTIWMYALYVEGQRVNRYLLTFVSFVMGLMAKPMLVTLPFVLLLLDYWPLKRFQRSREINLKILSYCWLKNSNCPKWRLFALIFEKIPFFALSAISSVIAYYAQLNAGAIAPLDIIPFSKRIANSLISYVMYMWKMIWPQNLAIIYPYPSTIPEWQTFISALSLLALSYLFLVYLRKPYITMGWLWYLGTLVPVIGLVQLGGHSMADRYTYIPLIGLFIIISWSIHVLGKVLLHLRTLFSLLSCTITICFMVCTFLQLCHWRDSIWIFQHALLVTKDNYLAHKYMGNTFAKNHKHNGAIWHLSEALRLRPNFTDAHNDLAFSLAAMGGLEKAVFHFREALRINPNNAKTHYNLAVILGQQNRISEAVVHYSEALRIDPNNPRVHNNLGLVMAQQGRLNEALYHYAESLRIDPNDQIARHNLAIAQRRLANHTQEPNTVPGP